MRLALTHLETARLAAALSHLLAPSPVSDADAWRTEGARALRTLVGADKAVFVLETAGMTRMYGDEIDRAAVRAYERHYGALDLGIQRQQALGLEVWSRARLWNREALVRSEYYNDFARPHRLHDTVGIAVALRSLDARVRVALFREAPLRDPAGTGRQLALLTLVLPAFKTGVTAHLRATLTGRVTEEDRLAALLNAAEDPQALYGVDGNLLHQNTAMTLALGGDASGLLLRQALQSVARAAVASRGAGGTGAGEPVTREVDLSAVRYRIRGSLVVSGGATGSPAAVLLSLRRAVAPDSVSADELRARYGLTGREAEIAVLLLQRRANTEIARALVLSPHTVRHHTEHVLRKMGVQSRRALATLLGRN